MDLIRWGMIGCGDVAEVKSGPGFQKADGSALVAVMRRDRTKADDFARRHGVPRVYDEADALIRDPEVDAVYIATPPSTHCELALKVAAAGKPCLVEKPMAVNHAECLVMIEAFRNAGRPLWVAFYRRALPRFLKVRELLREGAIGRVTSVHVYVSDPLAVGDGAQAWRFNPEIAGAGLFLDLASHYFDIIDFLAGRITAAAGFAINTGGSYAAEDVTVAAFQIGYEANAPGPPARQPRWGGNAEGIRQPNKDLVGTGIWNFNAPESVDSITFTGSEGQLTTAVRADADVRVMRGGQRVPHAAAARGTEVNIYRFRNPPHVHQPLIQTIVDELRGRGRCESTGESGARASWVMDRCVERYYGKVKTESKK